MAAPGRRDTAIPPPYTATRKDTISISGLGPTRRATLLPNSVPTLPTPSRERSLSTLNTTIQTIDIVRELVPISLAKGVLSSISGILGIIKTTIANRGDFEELAEQCHTIGLTIWRATSGIPELQINDTVRRALTDLQSSVDNIQVQIEEKTKKNVGSQVFHVTINQEAITKWRNDLDRFLTLLNTELNISTNLKVDELRASFEQFRNGVTLNLHANVLAPVPEEIPTRPQVFVGREDLVRSTSQSLIECRDVALIGPGGMGKSSIARAVMNDEELAAKFLERRFFVRFDDMNPSQITFGTFLDRIAKALGFNSLANTPNLVTKALSSSQTLLVLDNAETFLDAAVDAGRIADAIDGFGALPNVAILITTRTTVLPPNLTWVRLRVPALEENAACEAFKMFYSPTIEPLILIKLLSAVDFHPLSINLLAQAAVQNEWSPEDLIVAWDRQRSMLLEGGDGKIQSIAVTIETSINSPSVVKLGDTIRHLLEVIAYLPQGLSKQRLMAIFPDVKDIETCADALCKHSLAYLNGDFITLLAPIRLYFAKRYNINIHKNPLLKMVQWYYKDHYEDALVIRTDDVNMEHVFSHLVTDPEEMVKVLDLIGDFVYTLLDNGPRPLAILPIIRALDPDQARVSVSCMSFLRGYPNARRTKAMLQKGQCLFAISTLMRWIGQIKESEKVVAEARALFIEAGRSGSLLLLLVDWGIAMIYTEQGNYIAAEDMYQSALKRNAARFRPNREFDALIKFGQATVDLDTGKPNGAKGALGALSIFKRVSDNDTVSMCWHTAAWAELYDGHLDVAKKYFEEGKALTDEASVEHFTMCVGGLAEVADLEGNYAEAKALRAHCLKLVLTLSECVFFSEGSAILATYLAMEGDLDRARELMVNALLVAMKHLSTRSVKVTYLAGCIELIAGEFNKAEEYFLQTVEDCVSLEEFTCRAQSRRALGELAIVKQDMKTAKAHFEAVSELCKFTGTPEDCLYRYHACYKLGETYDGWTLYREGHPMFRT